MESHFNLLVVDDEANQRRLLVEHLRDLGYQARGAASVAEAKAQLKEGRIDMVLSDFRLGDGTGEEILEFVRHEYPQTPFVLFTAFSSVQRAVEIMKKGAADYLTKPLDLDEVEIKVRNLLRQKTILEENVRLKEQLSPRSGFEGILFQSHAMQELVNLALRAAQSTATVLILGESGTGKELVARAIHQASAHAGGRLVAVNCAALNENLLESELFGHEKGAFTGADRRRIGRIEESAGGTLFLDEIGEISPGLQVKLLRVLQERIIQRLGSNQDIPVDFRLITATNQDLNRLTAEGRFRSDLYYRLNIITLALPPLRERKEDIPGLVDRFIRKYTGSAPGPVTGISRDALHLLMGFDFPGNVRELENLIERAMVLTRSSLLQPEDFPGLKPPAGDSLRDQILQMPLPEAVEALEKARIQRALEDAGQVQTRAAEALGISEKNLRYKMEKYGFRSRRG
jgi:two-component system NtrC family response regulator